MQRAAASKTLQTVRQAPILEGLLAVAVGLCLLLQLACALLYPDLSSTAAHLMTAHSGLQLISQAELLRPI